MIAALFVLVVPFKVALFFLLLTRFKLRARTSFLGSFSLVNYSEFGLIVGAVGTANGWIGNEWLVIIAIYGMGRIGTSAYDYLSERYEDVVIGVDYDPLPVNRHKEAGRNVIYGDPSDPDFWARTRPDKTRIRAVLLAMSKHAANLAAAKQIVDRKFPAMLAAAAHFDDEISAKRSRRACGIQFLCRSRHRIG